MLPGQHDFVYNPATTDHFHQLLRVHSTCLFSLFVATSFSQERISFHVTASVTSHFTIPATMKRRRPAARRTAVVLSLIAAASASPLVAPRYGQASVYVNNTAYFLGGILSDTSLATDFFSLDLTQAFNSSSAPFTNLTSLPVATGNAAAASGPDGRIYLLGGQTWSCSSNFVNVYDPESISWGAPQYVGTAPGRRQLAQTFMSNDNEIILYFGGASTSCSTGASTVYNTLNALSLKNSSWFTPGNANAPTAESNFALTRVKVGNKSSQILIIGGASGTQNTFVQMSQLALFDMDSQSWTFVTANTLAGQNPPDSRIGHTAVTTSGGKVIVYGGTVGPSNRAAVPQLVVLDTSSTPFQWSTPTVRGDSSLTPGAGLTGHSAIITDGDTMILAFGQDGNGNFNREMYFLDTNKMEWIESYTPAPTSLSSPDSPSTATNPAAGPKYGGTHAEPTSGTSSSSQDDSSSSSMSKTRTIAISTTIPLTIFAIASAAVIIIFLRKRRNARGRQTSRISTQHILQIDHPYYELHDTSPATQIFTPPRTPRRGLPSKRVFKRIFSNGKANPTPPPVNPRRLGLYLPAWAQEHARESSSSGTGDDEGGVEDRMVQMASMAFMAPKMQLRVVNPDQESVQEYDDDKSFRRRVSAGRHV